MRGGVLTCGRHPQTGPRRPSEMPAPGRPVRGAPGALVRRPRYRRAAPIAGARRSVASGCARSAQVSRPARGGDRQDLPDRSVPSARRRVPEFLDSASDDELFEAYGRRLVTRRTARTAISRVEEEPPNQELGHPPPGALRARRSSRAKRVESGGSSRLLGLAADVLVGPVVAFEGPVLLVVFEVPSRVEGVDRVLRQVPETDGLDLDFERSLAPEDALDAPQACAPEEAREAKVEAVQRVLGEAGSESPSSLRAAGDARLQSARLGRVARSRSGKSAPAAGSGWTLAGATRAPALFSCAWRSASCWRKGASCRAAACAASRSAIWCSTPSIAARARCALSASSSASSRGRPDAPVRGERALHVAERPRGRDEPRRLALEHRAPPRDAVVCRVDAHEGRDRARRPRGWSRRPRRRPRRSPSARPRADAASTRRSRRCAGPRRARARSA